MGDSTKRKIVTIYGCKGKTFHIFAGTAILSHGAFECPSCRSEIYDVSDTLIGREYFEFVRPDLNLAHSPPPLRTVTYRKSVL